MGSARIGEIVIGDGAKGLTLIAGPCMAESMALCLEVGRRCAAIARTVGISYVFKASFDKANRTSGVAVRGPGIDSGLAMLAAVRSEIGVPVLTDIHEPWQAEPAAEVVDAIQIPAFLCRQTDLILAAAVTGKCVNVKKGQFLAPWDAANIVRKCSEAGQTNLILTERGVSFGYNTLVVDMCALPQMRSLGVPVCLDATHAVQQPGGAGTQSGGRREFVPHLARAGAAVGIDALFLEVHPHPEEGLSDSATMLPLDALEGLLRDVVAIDAIVRRPA